ncbi:MAG: ABC transporter permease [Ilumatobacteraceae bacterium]
MTRWRKGSRGSWVGIALTALVAIPAVFASAVAPYNPFAIAGPPLAPPSGTHLMGTDALGRDLFSSVVHGARTSLMVGVGVTVPAACIGLIVGMTAGYVGGWVDGALMRVTEFIQIIPRFFLAIVVLAIFGDGYRNLVFVLAISSWPVIGRAIRSQVLVIRELPYVEAARMLGARTPRVLRREVLPSMWPTLSVMSALLVADVILIEASLSFLGLGDPNRASWGRLASDAQQYLRSAWWLALFPGCAIVVAVMGVNLIVDRSSVSATGDREMMRSQAAPSS